MKLKQLMLAPVALGMIAPVAANAADLNIAATGATIPRATGASISCLSFIEICFVL